MSEGVLGRVTLVVGPEELLAERAVAHVVASARQAAGGDIEVRELPGGGATGDDLAGLLAPSLFDSRKVIVVDGLQDAGESLLDALAPTVSAPDPDIALVLVSTGKQGRGGAAGKARKLLDTARKAGAAEVACAEVKTRRDKLRFLSAEMRAHRRKTTDDAIETLLDAIGGDLRSLASACSQLAADTEGVIDAEVVRRYYAGVAEVSGFTVADAALEGRTAEALEKLRWAVQSGLDPVPIVAALATGLRNVVRVASAGGRGGSAELARTLGMPPWKVDAVRRQVRGWSADTIAVALTAVVDADEQVKGAGTDAVYAVERAIVSIGRARAAS